VDCLTGIPDSPYSYDRSLVTGDIARLYPAAGQSVYQGMSMLEYVGYLIFPE